MKSAQKLITSYEFAFMLGEPFFRFLGLRKQRHLVGLSQVKRVLIVRVENGIGDMVLMAPFLRELCHNLPNAWITLVVEPQIYNLIELCPYVNEVLKYDWKVSGHYSNLQRHGRALRLAYKHLWRRRFDIAMLPRWDFDRWHGAFLVYLSGATWRMSFSENVNANKARVNTGFNRLFTHVLYDSTPKHEVEHNLDMICFLGGKVEKEHLEMWLGPEDEIFAENVLTSHKIYPGDRLIAFGPGAGEHRRMWPLSNFVELGAWLKKKYGAHILIVGGQGEEPLAQEIQQQLGDLVINAVGKTTIRQTAALLKRCRLHVGNDAGPMHLAAAASVPVIEISCHSLNGSPLHPNSPRRFSPWGVPHCVVQPEKAIAPCSNGCASAQAHCILSITVEKVKEAVVALL
jgi:ADP-heptose:LPS heptosyltransferase